MNICRLYRAPFQIIIKKQKDKYSRKHKRYVKQGCKENSFEKILCAFG